MIIPFSKYHGTGNDFIIINNFDDKIVENNNLFQILCNRHTGIGADGLILLNSSEKYDFEMRYFNSDGQLASFCGNGGRCIAAFAYRLGIVDKKMIFKACDGIHSAEIIENKNKNFIVKININDVENIINIDNMYVTDTGSPHAILFVEDINEIDAVAYGRKIRNDDKFLENGINVDFVQILDDGIQIRTYERGVEDETLSCGTGVTASALCFAKFYNKNSPVKVITRGGTLYVYFKIKGNCSFYDIILQGPATFIYEGKYFIN